MTVNNVIININTNSHGYLISLYDLNGVDFMFGKMLLTNTPPMHVPSTIYRRVPSYILPNSVN